METISNAANTAASTVTTLLYGQKQTENETAGAEPVSGEQGKGTVAEPFDKGNLETPGLTTGTTGTANDSSATGGDYLKLDPARNAPTTTESTSHTKPGGTTESGVPVLPLNPDDSALDGGNTTANTSSTTPAAGATSSTTAATTSATTDSKPADTTTSKPTDTTTASATDSTPATKDTTTKDTTTEGASTAKKENKTAEDIVHPSGEIHHSVDDKEANDPHSKMAGKTVRAADPTKTGASSDTKTPSGVDSTSKSDSTKSPTGSEKTNRFSVLKTKIKDKLHRKDKPAA